MDTSNYVLQLQQVEQALLTTTVMAEKVELEELKQNLLELLELTKQTDVQTPNVDKSKPDDEMQRFMNEIKEIDKQGDEEAAAGSSESATMDMHLGIIDELKSSLEHMIGHKCSVPHQHSWGSIAYHNAIVCGIENDIEMSDNGVVTIKLRILFTNPTHREMLPCSYYLDGECRFDADRCHYSHGEVVSIVDLRDYKAPEFERLERNCVVLAKLPDRLWHRGRVLCANFIEKTCRVRLDSQQHKEREKDFPFEDLFPILNDHNEDDSSDNTSSGESESEELDDLEAARRACLVEQSLFTYKPTQPLGEWEKHTRGIGSKLMEKMGYVHGTGLGSDGRGIVTPISAQILPQGRSLDHCMELREAANGDKDLFSVEKKLQQQKKKQEALNAKTYEREAQNKDVFSFLNETILSNKTPNNTVNSKSTAKPSLQEQSTKSLNVESVRIADDIRRKEREIAQLEVSLKRNASGTKIHKQLKLQLDTKTQELVALQRDDAKLSREQATRKTKDKLTVF